MVDRKKFKSDFKTLNISTEYETDKFTLKTATAIKPPPNPRVLVIDLGAYRIKAGFSTLTNPTMCFPPVVASVPFKSKQVVLCGNQIQNFLPVSSNDLNTPFSKGFITDFPLMENILDYIIDTKTESSVKEIDFPFLLTEPLENFTKGAMTELLFEYYKVPSLCYANDFLLSRFYSEFKSMDSLNGKKGIRNSKPLNNPKKDFNKTVDDFISNEYIKSSGVVLSTGHNKSFLVPIEKGTCVTRKALSIPIGGKTPGMLLSETLRLKTPALACRYTEPVVRQVLEKACYTAGNYDEELTKYSPLTSKGNSKQLDISMLNSGTEKCFMTDFLIFCKKRNDLNEESDLIIETFGHLELVRNAVQIFRCILLRKEDLTLEYSSFLRLISEFGIESESDFIKLTLYLENRLKEVENEHPNLVVQKTTHYDRVKTRERLRKQKEIGHKRLCVMSGVDTCLRDTRTKFWDCSQLIISEVLTFEDLLTVINDFKKLRSSEFTVTLEAERIKATECFFKPHLVGFYNVGGIGDALNRLQKDNISTKNIFMTGGAGKLKGFRERIIIEAVAASPSGQKVNVVQAEDPILDPWKGGSLFSNSEYFKKCVTTFAEYEENGRDVVYKEHIFSGNYKNISPDLMEEVEM